MAGEVLGSVGSGAALGATVGSIVPGVGTAVGTVVGGVAGLIGGLLQKKKANKLIAGNQYQQAAIPQEAMYNQQLAKQMANEGLPSQQYANAMKNIQRQQAGALRSAQDRRSGVGLIGQIQQNTNDATANLDAANANARLQNQRQLLGVNNQVAGYRVGANDRNAQNTLRNYQYGMGLLGSGNQNIIGGIDSLGSAITQSGLFGGGKYKTPTAKISNSINSYI